MKKLEEMEPYFFVRALKDVRDFFKSINNGAEIFFIK